MSFGADDSTTSIRPSYCRTKIAFELSALKVRRTSGYGVICLPTLKVPLKTRTISLLVEPAERWEV